MTTSTQRVRIGRPFDGATVESERAARAYALSEQGKKWREIAEALGYSHPASARNAALRHMRSQLYCEQERLRYLKELDGLWDAIWPKAEAGDEQAVTHCLAILELQAKFIGIAPDEPLAALLSAVRDAQIARAQTKGA